jgi:hypothetical protein
MAQCKYMITIDDEDIRCKSNALIGKKLCWKHTKNYKPKKYKSKVSVTKTHVKIHKDNLIASADLAVALVTTIRYIVKEELRKSLISIVGKEE